MVEVFDCAERKDVLIESHRADIIEKTLKLLRRESRDLAGPA